MNMDMEKERRIILAKSLGKKMACMIIGGITVDFTEEDDLTVTIITVKNEITKTQFVYRDKYLYYDYFFIMKPLDDLLHKIMVDYRKYVNSMFYKRTETDKNTIKKWITDNERLMNP